MVHVIMASGLQKPRSVRVPLLAVSSCEGGCVMVGGCVCVCVTFVKQ